MSGNFLSCSKGVKDPFEEQEGRCDFPRDAAVIKGGKVHYSLGNSPEQIPLPSVGA